VPLLNAFDWIEQISKYRDGYIKVLTLTGGEPFYDPEKLNKISSFADNKGLFVWSVTNAFWAITPEDAIDILRRMPSIKLISISTDIYHQEYIPFERIKNALYAAEKCEIDYNINICTTSLRDLKYKKIIAKLEKIARKESISTSIIIPVGRAKKMADISCCCISEEVPIAPCTTINSPLIMPDGKVLACCGALLDLHSRHSLILGDLQETSLQNILDASELNPILHMLRLWGPGRLLSIIKDAGLAKNLPKKYIENCSCHACYSMLSDSEINNFLFKLKENSEFNRLVAFARAYYFGENQMAEHNLTTCKRDESPG
jgi:hypothetical protein